MTTHIHRRIFKGIKALAEGATVVVLRHERHVVIEVARPGVTPRHMSLASSPKNEEHAIRNAISQACKLLEIP